MGESSGEQTINLKAVRRCVFCNAKHIIAQVSYFFFFSTLFINLNIHKITHIAVSQNTKIIFEKRLSDNVVHKSQLSLHFDNYRTISCTHTPQLLVTG